MLPLPLGEVTFCFTDIEGSTRLARQLGSEWLSMLSHHNALLRRVWDEHDGVEVKTEGDAFFVVFVRPDAALDAALQAQRALSQLPLRVRIGLHTGVAEIAENDYVGLAVHMAARVADAAHGGQVLVSSSLVGAGLPDGAHLDDLGLFRLKGFDEPQQLLRLRHEGLTPHLAAPRVAPAASHNLPILRSSFVGRQGHVAELARLCERERLVTVLAPGGAGKTRIALETGRGLAKGDADGVWAVLLAGEPMGAEIAPLVARTLGIGDGGGQSVTNRLVEGLRDKHLLLILDNCEHVLVSAAGLADELLRSCPGIHVLATSRQPLGVDGEHVWRLPSLALPLRADSAAVGSSAAGQLFIQRATSAGAAFELTDDAAADVAAVCAALDGLPLALELAAATARAVPLPALRRRIESGSVALRAASPVGPARQRSVDDLIGWSYELLDEVQAAVFRRLAVLRGGWTLEAAEAVCQGGVVSEAEVLPALVDLVDRCLVSVESEDRYRMLVLISAYARGRDSPPGERAEAELAHLAWFAELASRNESLLNSPQGLRLIRADQDNLSAAYDHAALLHDAAKAFLLCRAVAVSLLHAGHYDQANDLLEPLEHLLEEMPAERLQIMTNRTHLLRVLERNDEFLQLCERARALAVDLGNNYFDLMIGREQAALLQSQGRHREAEVIVRECLERASDPHSRCQLLESLASIVEALGDEPAGAELREQAAYLLDAEGDTVHAAACRADAAGYLASAGLLDRAVAHVEGMLELCSEGELPRELAIGLTAAAQIRRRASDPNHPAITRLPESDYALDEAARIAEDVGVVALSHVILAERAYRMLQAGRVLDALIAITQTTSDLRSVQHEELRKCLIAAAALHAGQEGIEQASALAATALAVLTDPALRPALERLEPTVALKPEEAASAVNEVLASLPNGTRGLASTP